MNLKNYKKSFELKSATTITGAEITAEMLAKINAYALKPLMADKVYVRKFILAHNAIDRDNERFNEVILDDFVTTLPGKSLLLNHDRRSSPLGLWFDASTEFIIPEQFKTLTGEMPVLPPGVDKIKVLWTWFYMLNAPFNEEKVANIDAGIYRHGSIGFAASDLIPVYGANQEILYYEYKGRGEALEGSIVWLGAQPGATLQKGASEGTEEVDQPEGFHIHKKRKEGERMKTVLKRLGLAEDATEDAALKVVNQKLLRLDAVEGIVSAIGEDATVESVKQLKTDAADGVAYRKSLVDDAVKFGALVGEVKADAESQKKEADFIATWPIDRIKELKEKNEAKARKQFPDKFSINGKDETDRQKAAEEAERAARTTGKKDYTDPKHNELFETVRV